MHKTIFSLTLFCGLASASLARADGFTLTSTDMKEGHRLTQAQVFKGFGCDGGNISPHLQWTGAPKAAKSFVVTAYDPDAPTGSGWWHWVVYDIPAKSSTLKRGAGAADGAHLPAGARQASTDFGALGFGGACPPPGEVHRYVFTVTALDVEKLPVPENATPALIGFMTRAHALGSARLTSVWSR